MLLFAPTTRSIRLTRAGALFLEYVPRVFAALQQARQRKGSAAANGFHSQLRIALSEGITPPRLPACRHCAARRNPRSKFASLFEASLSQQIKGLHDDLYDVGFAQSNEVGDGIVAAAVWSDPLMVAVLARHDLLKHKRIPLEEVLRFPLVLSLQREAMHPADQFEAFAALVAEGRPVEDIAADFSVTPLVVRRRLAGCYAATPSKQTLSMCATMSSSLILA